MLLQTFGMDFFDSATHFSCQAATFDREGEIWRMKISKFSASAGKISSHVVTFQQFFL